MSCGTGKGLKRSPVSQLPEVYIALTKPSQAGVRRGYTISRTIWFSQDNYAYTAINFGESFPYFYPWDRCDKVPVTDVTLWCKQSLLTWRVFNFFFCTDIDWIDNYLLIHMGNYIQTKDLLVPLTVKIKSPYPDWKQPATSRAENSSDSLKWVDCIFDLTQMYPIIYWWITVIPAIQQFSICE